MWLPLGQRVRYNKWRPFVRIFSTGKTEERYIREIIFGKKREIRYWQVTNNTETLPENSTWYIMSNIPGIKYKEVGNLYEFSPVLGLGIMAIGGLAVRRKRQLQKSSPKPEKSLDPKS